MALGLKYLRAIERAGGVPLVVPPIHDRALLGSLLDRVSGLCLSGGPDLDPVAYGQRRHEMIGPTWRELDTSELSLVQMADERRLPILAICRGLQALNVSRGGTLHQHVPDVTGDRITHRQTEPGEEPTHWVTLHPGTRLAEIMRCRRTRVNSFHHQGAAELGENLAVAARAPDGIVEGIEAVDRDFVLGVQWHAECLIGRPRQLNLFRGFVTAARRFETSSAVFRRAA
jgi:putative glutamine amidotransferase